MIRHSGSTRPDSSKVHDWSPDFRSEANGVFFERALGELADVEGSEQGYMAIGLVGSGDLPGITLRRAQSVLRWDLRPSLWSHAFVLAGRKEAGGDVGDVRLREVPIYSRTGAFPEPADNAVADGVLKDYDSPTRDPNVALLSVRLNEGDANQLSERAIRDPNLDRARYDLWGSLAAWSAYLWAPEDEPNPLRNDVPLFSSAFWRTATRGSGSIWLRGRRSGTALRSTCGMARCGGTTGSRSWVGR